MRLGSPTAADLVSDHRLGLAVLAGPSPSLPIYATSAALPWVLRVVALSALLSGAFSWSLLPAQLLYKQNRAFSVVGPSLWNGLPLMLRLHPRIHSESFYTCLKTVLFSRAVVGSAPE